MRPVVFPLKKLTRKSQQVYGKTTGRMFFYGLYYPKVNKLHLLSTRTMKHGTYHTLHLI